MELLLLEEEEELELEEGLLLLLVRLVLEVELFLVGVVDLVLLLVDFFDEAIFLEVEKDGLEIEPDLDLDLLLLLLAEEGVSLLLVFLDEEEERLLFFLLLLLLPELFLEELDLLVAFFAIVVLRF